MTFQSLLERHGYSEFGKMESEFERTPDYGCMDGHIDDAETKNNYHILYPKGSYEDLGGPYIRTEADGTERMPCLITSVITADEDFFDIMGDACQHQFFTDAANYFLDTFGKRNVFTAVVHMDEGYPHMHVAFFPYDSDGNLTEIGEFSESARRKFRNDIYEKVGRRWHLEKTKNTGGQGYRVKEEYLFARQMYFFQQDVSDILRLIDDERRELWDVKEQVEDLKEQKRILKRSVRELGEEKEALTEERNRLREDVLEETDFHAGMYMACAETNPSYSKDKTIRILKSRIYVLGDRINSDDAEKKSLLGTILEKDKTIRAQDKAVHDAMKYKERADIADRLQALYPDIYNELARGTSRAKGKDKADGKSQAV